MLNGELKRPKDRITIKSKKGVMILWILIGIFFFLCMNILMIPCWNELFHPDLSPDAFGNKTDLELEFNKSFLGLITIGLLLAPFNIFIAIWLTIFLLMFLSYFITNIDSWLITFQFYTH